MKKGRSYVKYIIYFCVLAVAGGLLIAALYGYINSPESSELGLVRSETMYVMVTLAVLLPVLIVAFIFVNLRRKTHITSVTDNLSPVSDSDSAADDKTSKRSKKTKDRVEEGKGKRFPTLLKIKSEAKRS